MASLVLGLAPSTPTITGKLLLKGDVPVPASSPCSPRRHPTMQLPTPRPTNSVASPSLSKLENLPVEIFDQILSYLTHPRARLPGLTEAQSTHDFPSEQKTSIRKREDLTQPPDNANWAADVFSLYLLSHPFNAISLTSKRCNQSVESYCSHLVRACNRTMFNLPFAQFDKHGPHCVYPSLNNIIYRRLWLQHAPRRCVYCFAVLDCYPFPRVKRVVTSCEDCFYRQTLTLDEVQTQYHISPPTILSSPHIRGNRESVWVLRIDVEALALQLYRTRAFHSAHKEQLGRPCSLCAITRFTPECYTGRKGGAGGVKGMGSVGPAGRQMAGMRKRSAAGKRGVGAGSRW